MGQNTIMAIFIYGFYWLAYLLFTHDIAVSHWLKVCSVGGLNRRGTVEGGTIRSNRKTKERRVYLANKPVK